MLKSKYLTFSPTSMIRADEECDPPPELMIEQIRDKTMPQKGPYVTTVPEIHRKTAFAIRTKPVLDAS
jgi:hypothetical protein